MIEFGLDENQASKMKLLYEVPLPYACESGFMFMSLSEQVEHELAYFDLNRPRNISSPAAEMVATKMRKYVQSAEFPVSLLFQKNRTFLNLQDDWWRLGWKQRRTILRQQIPRKTILERCSQMPSSHLIRWIKYRLKNIYKKMEGMYPTISEIEFREGEEDTHVSIFEVRRLFPIC